MDNLKHEVPFFRPAQDRPYESRPAPVLSPTRTYSSPQNPNQTQYFSGSPVMSQVAAPSQGHPFNQNAGVPAFPMASYPAQTSQHTSTASFVAAVSQGLNALHPTSTGPYVTMPNGPLGMDMTAAYAYPVFGGDEYNRSPNAMGDDFTDWLFNENQSAALGYPSAVAVMPGLNDATVMPFAGPYYPVDPSTISIYPNVVPPQQSMSLMSIVDSSDAIHYAMSDDKRQELLELMSEQFNERPHDAVKKRKNAVFEGDLNADNHILSLRMMHSYVGSYWSHQHAQLPILHKPTFTADKTPNLLLLMVMAIGAATLDKAYGTSLTDSAAEFANFIVWHVRWEIMRDADSRPPAKLWVFQTLLLVEIYEKMYATRALHERGHIHHDSTLTLMRRGSSLIGRPALDSPPSLRDDKTGRSSGSNSAPDTPGSEETWTRWITEEATRRAAFAAFVMDSIHATMFGHTVRPFIVFSQRSTLNRLPGKNGRT
jgi:Fungal specific transcription factor domain